MGLLRWLIEAAAQSQPQARPAYNPGLEYGTPNAQDHAQAREIFQQLWGRLDHEQYLSDATLAWRNALKTEVCVALNTLYTDACGCGGRHWTGEARNYAPADRRAPISVNATSHNNIGRLVNSGGGDGLEGILRNIADSEAETKRWVREVWQPQEDRRRRER